MKDLKDIIKVLIVLGTLIANAFLIYFLLYDPFSQILLDKNQPYYIPESHPVIQNVTFIIMGLLIITSVFLMLKIYRKQKIFVWAPMFTLLTICAIFLVSCTSLKYPSSTSAYAKDGYYYKIEIWWNMPNHIKTYKRWKSVLPYDGESNTDEMEYKLDSLSNTKDD